MKSSTEGERPSFAAGPTFAARAACYVRLITAFALLTICGALWRIISQLQEVNHASILAVRFFRMFPIVLCVHLGPIAFKRARYASSGGRSPATEKGFASEQRKCAQSANSPAALAVSGGSRCACFGTA